MTTIYSHLCHARAYHIIHALFLIAFSSRKSNEEKWDLSELPINLSGSGAVFSYFIKRGNREVVNYCLDNNIFNLDSYTMPHNLLHYACKRGWPEVVGKLLRSKNHSLNNRYSSSDDKHICGSSPLIVAVKARRHAVVDYLLHPGTTDVDGERINPNLERYKDRATPLILAVLMRDPIMVKAILDNIDVDYTYYDDNGYSALTTAISRVEDPELINLILRHPRVKNEFSFASIAIKEAAKTGNSEVYKAVIDALIDNYEEHIKARKSEFVPCVGMFFSTIFHCKGFTKSEKEDAVDALRKLLNGEIEILSDKQIYALRNGRLSSIAETIAKHRLKGAEDDHPINQMIKRLHDNVFGPVGSSTLTCTLAATRFI